MNAAVVMAAQHVARSRQERIRLVASTVREGIDTLGTLVHEAKEANDFEALGYHSWTDYLADTLGAEPMRLDRAERREVVALLAGEGMSTRAIAPIVAATHTTVRRDLSQLERDVPPESEPTRAALVEGERTGSVVQLTGPPPVTGLDGKQYSRPQAPAGPVWSDEEQQLRDRLDAGETVTVSFRAKRHANLIAWAEKTGRLVRIDRRSIWGNPFELGPDGDRDTVIDAYAQHYLPHKPSLLAQIANLRGGKALACWCAPEPCHGDVLKARAEM